MIEFYFLLYGDNVENRLESEISYLSLLPGAPETPYFFLCPLTPPASFPHFSKTSLHYPTLLHSHLQEPCTLTFMPGSALPSTHLGYAQIFADIQ